MNWTKEIKNFFPHGFRMLVGKGTALIRVIDPEVKVDGEDSYLFGWAYPNKDILIDLSTVTTAEDIWKATWGDKSVQLAPLSKEDAKNEKAAML